MKMIGILNNFNLLKNINNEITEFLVQLVM